MNIQTICVLAMFAGLSVSWGSGSTGSRSHSETEPSRKFVKTDWVTTLVIGGSARDTLVRIPSRLDSDGANLYVFDRGWHALSKFNSRGQLVWRRGREGHGPGEYGSVRDISMDMERSLSSTRTIPVLRELIRKPAICSDMSISDRQVAVASGFSSWTEPRYCW
jgi:hypothetical protein